MRHDCRIFMSEYIDLHISILGRDGVVGGKNLGIEHRHGVMGWYYDSLACMAACVFVAVLYIFGGKLWIVSGLASVVRYYS